MTDEQKTFDYCFNLQAQNNHWCNQRLLKACKQLNNEEYFAIREAFFDSIHATLVHIAHTDQLYLWRLKRLPMASLPELNSFITYQSYQFKLDQELIDYVIGMNSEKLKEIVSFTLLDGTRVDEIRARILIHLSNHQIHHRGQVHNLLSQTSIKPPQLDEFYF